MAHGGIIAKALLFRFKVRVVGSGKDCPRQTAKEHPDPCLSLFVFVLPDRLA